MKGKKCKVGTKFGGLSLGERVVVMGRHCVVIGFYHDIYVMVTDEQGNKNIKLSENTTMYLKGCGKTRAYSWIPFSIVEKIEEE